MNDQEMIQLIRLVAKYANAYETAGGMMSLRDLVLDAETSMDNQESAELVAQIAEGIKWT